MDIQTRIKEIAASIAPEIVAIRHHLHQHPELSFQETKTSLFVQNKLSEYGIPFNLYVDGKAVVAKLEGKNPTKRVIALRADMDALPIDEQTDIPFASKHKGVMHACGHDAHTASLLGTAAILSQLRDDWEGTVLFIFQPGEETFPGGAKLLLDEGALNNPKPQLIIGQHVLPEMAAGHVGFKEGLYMASGDEIYLTITGKGGHGAMPHTLNDTVLAAAHTVVALQQIASRFVPANIPTVLSFGRFIANGATNVIPEKVEIAGTLRTMDETWRQKIKEKIITTAQSVSEAMGTECKVTINNGYPMVFNHQGITRQSVKLAKEYLGDAQVEEMEIRMTAEDFGYYTQVFPSTFYRFGVKQLTGDTGALHTSCFNLNDAALETSAGLMAWLAISLTANQ
jgi:amidohydrolase